CDPPRLRENVSVERAGNEYRRPGTRRRLADDPRRGRRPRSRHDSDGDHDEACQQKPSPRRHPGNLVVATLRANTSSGDIYEHSPRRALNCSIYWAMQRAPGGERLPPPAPTPYGVGAAAVASRSALQADRGPASSWSSDTSSGSLCASAAE